MVYVPSPRPPAVGLSSSEPYGYRRRTFLTDGTPRGWIQDGDTALVYKSYKTHMTNKIRWLKPGVPWKPVGNFTAGRLKVTRSHGRTLTVRKSDSIPTNESEGYSHTGPYWGPFLNHANLNVTVTPISMPTSIRSRLATEVMLKVGDRKVNYGESLGESRATVKHLAQSASTLARAVLAARKGNWKGAARALGLTPKRFKSGVSPAERWLEYQYGWLPLMGDIYDTAELLKKGFRESKPIMSEVRNLKDFHQLTAKAEPANSSDALYGNSTISYRAKVYFSIDDSTLNRLGQMGLINPLEVAWALVPFSFVVDWFMPVGNMMEALSARCGVDFIDGYYGTRVNGHYTQKNWLSSLQVVTHRFAVDTRHTRCDFSAYRRERMTGFPVPGLYFKSPFSSTHLTSALALVRQLTK